MKRGNNNVFKLSGNLALGSNNDYLQGQNSKNMNSYSSGISNGIRKMNDYNKSYQNTYDYDYKQKSSTSQKRKMPQNLQQNGNYNYNLRANYENSSSKKIQNNYQNALNKLSTGDTMNYGGGSYKQISNYNNYNRNNEKGSNDFRNQNSLNRKQPQRENYGYEETYQQNRNLRSKVNQTQNYQNYQQNKNPPKNLTNNTRKINNIPLKNKYEQNQDEDNNQHTYNTKNEISIKEYDPSTFKMCRQGCGRKFNPDSILKHQKICKKVFQNKRSQFNTQQQRLVAKQQKKLMKQGEIVEKKMQQKKKVQSKKQNIPKWKAQSLGFRAIMKANRRGGQMTQEEKKLVNQAQQSSMIKCKCCGRSFSQKAAQRHIPFCQAQQKKNAMKKKK